MIEVQQKRAETYRRIAYTLGGIGVTAFVLSVIAYGARLGFFNGQTLSAASQDWGTFGDFVGGLAGTIIALATLVAVVVTLRVQGLELELTRTELEKQTAAAREQTTQMREVEARRVRPLLKTEWFVNGSHFVFRVRNVGLGPCILDSIEMFVGTERLGNHAVTDHEKAATIWLEAVQRAVGIGFQVSVRTWTDSMRVLAVNEFQEFLSVTTDAADTPQQMAALFRTQTGLNPIVHFRSVDGTAWSTVSQIGQ